MLQQTDHIHDFIKAVNALLNHRDEDVSPSYAFELEPRACRPGHLARLDSVFAAGPDVDFFDLLAEHRSCLRRCELPSPSLVTRCRPSDADSHLTLFSLRTDDRHWASTSVGSPSRSRRFRSRA